MNQNFISYENDANDGNDGNDGGSDMDDSESLYYFLKILDEHKEEYDKFSHSWSVPYNFFINTINDLYSTLMNLIKITQYRINDITAKQHEIIDLLNELLKNNPQLQINPNLSSQSLHPSQMNIGPFIPQNQPQNYQPHQQLNQPQMHQQSPQVPAYLSQHNLNTFQGSNLPLNPQSAPSVFSDTPSIKSTKTDRQRDKINAKRREKARADRKLLLAAKYGAKYDHLKKDDEN